MAESQEELIICAMFLSDGLIVNIENYENSNTFEPGDLVYQQRDEGEAPDAAVVLGSGGKSLYVLLGV